MSPDYLLLLFSAAGLERMFKEFQQSIEERVAELHHEVAALKEDHMDATPPEGLIDREDQHHDRGSSPPIDPVLPGMDASVQRIKEMKILQPQGEDDFYGSTRAKNPTRVVKVTPATEVILKQSFESLTNDDWSIRETSTC